MHFYFSLQQDSVTGKRNNMRQFAKYCQKIGLDTPISHSVHCLAWLPDIYLNLTPLVKDPNVY